MKVKVKVNKIDNWDWEIKVTSPAAPSVKLLGIPIWPSRKEKIRTYIGDYTVWHCIETGGRPGTLQEYWLSDICRKAKIKKEHPDYFKDNKNEST